MGCGGGGEGEHHRTFAMLTPTGKMGVFSSWEMSYFFKLFFFNIFFLFFLSVIWSGSAEG